MQIGDQSYTRQQKIAKELDDFMDKITENKMLKKERNKHLRRKKVIKTN